MLDFFIPIGVSRSSVLRWADCSSHIFYVAFAVWIHW